MFKHLGISDFTETSIHVSEPHVNIQVYVLPIHMHTIAVHRFCKLQVTDRALPMICPSTISGRKKTFDRLTI